ncbi:MAG TPA: hypothetical protein PKY77_20175 [Phycisphaerae bacterium]|nr:hypothetical protein [Phycisphaerae bacterium]HRY71064.1 hypothetical protein [Phycisphaerae bacterium]HSA29154.1 hypothetical protein [Phycisphaerae bacterium]
MTEVVVMLPQGRRGGDFWVIVVAVVCMIFSLAVTYWKQCRDKRH